MKYCKYCMAEIEDNAAVCPVCGKDLTDETQIQLHHLRPGTKLSDKYTVGAVLGEGGFGITYIGINERLKLRVAIKEFFPFGYVNRVSTMAKTVTERTDITSEDFFKKGRSRFLEEARLLAQLNSEPGVVSVYDFFEENNTAYIVMEYLEGQTLKDHLKKKGRLSYDETVSLLMPVMRSLSEVHEKGLIHRDISPDNIMLTGKSVKLLDFGAARYADGDKSLSVMLKHGYAPEEQYRRKGDQGPWTDVYALSATIYKCITGATPDESNERTFEDNLKKPSDYGVEIDPKCEAALLKGLAVYAKDRYRSVNELINGLLGKDNVPAHPTAVKPVPDSEKTVYGGDDPDKTVFGDDPDKTVFTNEPEYGKKPEPKPEYKEKDDKPKEKTRRKTINIVLVFILIVVVIIGAVAAVLYIKGNVHNHTAGSFTVVKQPTCAEDGIEELTCTGCGEVLETRMISALGHDYGTDGECKRCGNIESTSYKYFDFELLDSDTYEIKAKNVDNMPAKVGIPLKYTGIPVTSIGNSAFKSCKNLTKVTIGNGITNIGAAAFSGCIWLKSVTIPDSVTNIGYEAFSGCSSLTSVTIPSSVTSIDDRTFSGCSNLTSITIHDGVKIIGSYTFSRCIDLTNITYKGTKAQWGEISKAYSWNFGTGNYTVHCTDGDIPKD